MSPKPTTNPTAPAPSCSLKGGAGDSFQHTPGPWGVRVQMHNMYHLDEKGQPKPLCLIAGNVDKDGDGDSIASVTTRFYNGGTSSPRSLEGEWQANAHLIAAAPDYHFWVQRLIAELPQNRDWLDPEIERGLKAAIAKAKGQQ